MKSPYPYFGGKGQVAPEIWSAFGNAQNYIEPFFGSGAVLLAAPWPAQRIETVNDINAWLTNFWRAVQRDPDGVAQHADYPVSELDLHARGDWLFYRSDALEFVERMRADPDYYDAKSAGWWVWGISQWIGSGWERNERGRVKRQLPHLSAGKGIHRRAKMERSDFLRDYLRALARRMRNVRICCGDWRRVLGPSPTTKLGVTAVFLDPPYAPEGRYTVYGAHDDPSIFADVREWSIANGDNPLLRIALCGYDFDMPPGWTPLRWQASGDYGNQGASSGRANKRREMVWFSPRCVLASQMELTL